jgi:hypothetical protein
VKWTGLCVLLLSEAGMIAKVEPFWTWHTPIAWTGYILFVDGLVYERRGSSWLTADKREFVFLAVASIPLWLVFEAYNLLIRNWHYINLPENPVARYAGFAWAFATISPAIFVTAELIAALRSARTGVGEEDRTARAPRRERDALDHALVAAGAAMLLWPIAWPSPHLAAPVFLGFVFLLDPINAWRGHPSLLGDIRRGEWSRTQNILAGGFVCGVLWEFWNYWARAKWIYTVPIFGDVKIFEMPVLGYFGFPPFALECFAMYVFVRSVFWPRPGRQIGL